MMLHNPTAEIYIPDGRPQAAALKRITHLGIGAHQDDLEFMAFHGIWACHASRTKWFGGVTCTNGAGSARAGRFKQFTDEQMMAVRRREQNRAAKLGWRDGWFYSGNAFAGGRVKPGQTKSNQNR